MRIIGLNELMSISGGDNNSNHYYSDAFLAGMKGSDYPYSVPVAVAGIFGAVVGG